MSEGIRNVTACPPKEHVPPTPTYVSLDKIYHLVPGILESVTLLWGAVLSGLRSEVCCEEASGRSVGRSVLAPGTGHGCLSGGCAVQILLWAGRPGLHIGGNHEQQVQNAHVHVGQDCKASS